MVKENSMKQTEIGLLPEDWELVDLKTLINEARPIRYGVVQPGIYNSKGCLMLRSQDYSKGWKGTENMHRVISSIENQYRGTKLIDGDLVMTIVGAGLGQIVKLPSWINGTLLSRSTARISINDIAKSDYIYQFLSSNFGFKQLIENVKEGAQPVISATDISKTKIPLPPLPEQEAIAEALSDADAWIESLEQLIAKKRLIKQGAMQELLTPEEDWEVRKLGEVLIKIPDYGLNAAAVKYNDELPNYLRITDIGDNGEYLIDGKVSVNHQLAINYFLDAGDICIARTGASVGKSYYHNEKDGKLVFAGFLIRVKANPLLLDSKLLFYITKSKSYDNFIISNSMRSGQPGINSFELQSFEICIPTSLTEQTRIATILSDMDAELEALEAQLGKARKVKQGMMQELLTGRVRLV